MISLQDMKSTNAAYVLTVFYDSINHDGFVKGPHRVILRSGATKNLNDIRLFAIAQNEKRVFL